MTKLNFAILCDKAIVGENKKAHIIAFHLDINGVDEKTRTFLRLLEVMPHAIDVKHVQLELEQGNKENVRRSSKMLVLMNVATDPLKK